MTYGTAGVTQREAARVAGFSQELNHSTASHKRRSVQNFANTACGRGRPRSTPSADSWEVLRR